MEVGNSASVSRDSGRNAYHIRCDVVGHARPYAVCAHLCELRKKGELNEIYSECSTAIGKKVCPALAMLEEEKTQNAAIYFIERVKGIAVNMRKAVSGSLGKKEEPKTGDYNKSQMNNDFEQIDFAEAINSAREKIDVPQEGESFLQMAKRLVTQQRKQT
jgi:hypothetical protein